MLPTACALPCEPLSRDQAQLRKRSNKPLMERKRRERINKSLDTIKDLVLKAENKDASKYSKLEKADILEMAVKHVQNLHDNSDGSAEYVSKYRAGFSRCTSEVESFIRNMRGFPNEVLQRLISHLHNVLQSLAKENIPQPTTKVKATTDKSILKCKIVPKEEDNGIVPCHAQSSEFESLQRFPEDTSTAASFPLSPLECPSSYTPPDSFRGSPNSTCFLDPTQQVNYPPSSNYILLNRSSILTCAYLTQETSPLNLTTRQTGYPSAPPMPGFPVKQYSHSLPPSPPSERSSPTTPPFNTKVSSAGKSAKQPRAASFRTNPYPKKDAARRYQTESAAGGKCSPAVNHNGSKSTTFHWRPW